MANPAIRVLNDAGSEVLFDSWTDDVLFFVAEQVVDSTNYDANRQVTFSYPQLAGRKIMAYIDAPYGSGSISGNLIPSCRVTYSGTMPVVFVFIDDTTGAYPIAPGLLTIMLSGVSL